MEALIDSRILVIAARSRQAKSQNPSAGTRSPYGFCDSSRYAAYAQNDEMPGGGCEQHTSNKNQDILCLKGMQAAT